MNLMILILIIKYVYSENYFIESYTDYDDLKFNCDKVNVFENEFLIRPKNSYKNDIVENLFLKNDIINFEGNYICLRDSIFYYYYYYYLETKIIKVNNNTKELIIKCKDNGYTIEPLVIWTREENGIEIIYNEKINRSKNLRDLRILNFNKNDTGIYYCKTSLGNILSKTEINIIYESINYKDIIKELIKKNNSILNYFINKKEIRIINNHLYEILKEEIDPLEYSNNIYFNIKEVLEYNNIFKETINSIRNKNFYIEKIDIKILINKYNNSERYSNLNITGFDYFYDIKKIGGIETIPLEYLILNTYDNLNNIIQGKDEYYNYENYYIITNNITFSLKKNNDEMVSSICEDKINYNDSIIYRCDEVYKRKGSITFKNEFNFYNKTNNYVEIHNKNIFYFFIILTLIFILVSILIYFIKSLLIEKIIKKDFEMILIKISEI